MRSKGLRSVYRSEGKGFIGCILSLVLLGVAIFLAVNLGPIYYANMNFESDVEAAVSRAGARSLPNDAVVTDILNLAKKNQIRIEKEDIHIERFAGQVHVSVNYVVPVNFVLYQRNMNFQVKASSFIGSL
jgi:hypothetical protein